MVQNTQDHVVCTVQRDRKSNAAIGFVQLQFRVELFHQNRGQMLRDHADQNTFVNAAKAEHIHDLAGGRPLGIKAVLQRQRPFLEHFGRVFRQLRRCDQHQQLK